MTLFFKSPFDALKIAANNENMANFQDIACKQCDTILKWVHKNHKAENKEVRPFITTTDAREVLLDYIREGIVTEDHPVFDNWPNPQTAGLITALNIKNLISQLGQAKRVFKTESDPVAVWEEKNRLKIAEQNEAQLAEQNEIQLQNLTQQPSQENVSIESLSLESDTQVQPQVQPSQIQVQSQVQPSQTSVLPVTSSQQSPHNRSGSQNRSAMSQPSKKAKKPKEIPTNITASDLEKFSNSISASLNKKMTDDLKVVHDLFLSSSTKFADELKTKASQNYVRDQVNVLYGKMGELDEKWMTKIENTPSLINSNSVSPQTDINTKNINSLLERLDMHQQKIAELEEQIFPEVTDAFIATQIDLYQVARSDFKNAIFGQKRAGLLYISVPVFFFTCQGNSTEIHADAVADALGINFVFKSKTTVNKNKTMANAKIQITSLSKGHDAFKIVDELLGKRREIQQNQGILLKASIIQKFHFLNVLRHWMSTKIIFSYELTLGGQYKLFIGDGSDLLTTAKARNESCTDMIVDCPQMLFKLKNPTVEALMKISTKKFFPADNGHLYAIPEDKLWAFSNTYTPKTNAVVNSTQNVNVPNQNLNVNVLNQNLNQTRNVPNQNMNQTRPSILQTKPLNKVAAELYQNSRDNRYRTENKSFQSNGPLAIQQQNKSTGLSRQPTVQQQLVESGSRVPTSCNTPQISQNGTTTANHMELVAHIVEALRVTNFSATPHSMSG